MKGRVLAKIAELLDGLVPPVLGLRAVPTNRAPEVEIFEEDTHDGEAEGPDVCRVTVQARAIDLGRAGVSRSGAIRFGEVFFEDFAVVAEDSGAVGHDEHVSTGDIAMHVALVVQELETFHRSAKKLHNLSEVVLIFIKGNFREVAASGKRGEEVENVGDAATGGEGSWNRSRLAALETIAVSA